MSEPEKNRLSWDAREALADKRYEEEATARREHDRLWAEGLATELKIKGQALVAVERQTVAWERIAAALERLAAK